MGTHNNKGSYGIATISGKDWVPVRTLTEARKRLKPGLMACSCEYAEWRNNGK
jgi:hypothetical protein